MHDTDHVDTTTSARKLDHATPRPRDAPRSDLAPGAGAVRRDDPARARERTLAFARAFQRHCSVVIPLQLWDGTTIGDGDFRVVLNQPWSLRTLLMPPTDLNAGEAYLRDDVDVSGDLVAALHAIGRLRNELSLLDRARLMPRLLGLPTPPDDDVGIVDRAAMVTGRRHTRERDRDVVRFHYDLGNDFFRCFLDDDLVYSCAYFATPDTSLEMAQRRKLDTVTRKLALRPGERLLDVGCGWGSLVIHAARTFGVRAVGITLSTEQARAALRRAEEAGVGDRVDIRVADYREVSGTFDAIASIGMVEHVGSDKLPTYFRHLHGLLADGGRLLNHGITTGRRRITRDIDASDASFIGRYVFPDGGLVPASRTIHEVEEAGFELLDVQQLRPHYALTLREWVRRLESNHDRAVSVASEVDYRIWRAYMAGSVVGFERDDLGVVQVLAGRRATMPLDRGFMAPQVDGDDLRVE